MDTVIDVVPNTFPNLFYGYSAFWLILGVFLVVMLKKVAALERRLKELEKRGA